MQTGKILLSAFLGTPAMTIFSHLVSESKHKNFREPEVLALLAERLPQSGSNQSAQVVGGGMQYAIGLSFMAVYHHLWKQTDLKLSMASAATLLGVASGVADVIGWKGLFETHPNPPSKFLKGYFRHPILAHGVFGVFSAVTYKFINGTKRY